jgi:signal transduction histidine kinase
MNAMGQMLLKEYTGKVLDTKGQDYLRRITAAAVRMDALVVNLLAYSRLGRVAMRIERVELEPVVLEAIEHLRDDASRRGAEVVVDPPLHAVLGHRVILAQAVENLVANGLKFVDNGTTPRVRIHAERRGEMIRLWVDDNGIGIAPEYQERIFGVFERLHGSDQYPGTGIGLAIVRRAVERSGGRVGVESERGKGSHFWIELPEARDPA